MAVFSSRLRGYKVGFVCLMLVFVVFCVGFVSPSWISVDLVDGQVQVTQGLWLSCVSKSSSLTCESFDMLLLEGWFHAVRAGQAIGMTLLCMGVLFGLSANCRSVARPYSRALEFLCCFGAMFAMGGILLFIAKHKELVTSTENVDFSWGLYLSVLGSGGSFIAVVVISVHNKAPTAGQAESTGQVEGQQQELGVQYSAGMVHTVNLQAGGYYPPSSYGPPAYPSASPTSNPYPSVYSPLQLTGLSTELAMSGLPACRVGHCQDCFLSSDSQ